MAHERISIHSLLNALEQEPRPSSTTPSTIISYVHSASSYHSREITQTSRAIDHSPSPTLSQTSVPGDKAQRLKKRGGGGGGRDRIFRCSHCNEKYDTFHRKSKKLNISGVP